MDHRPSNQGPRLTLLGDMLGAPSNIAGAPSNFSEWPFCPLS